MWLKRVIVVCLFFIGVNLGLASGIIGKDFNLLTSLNDCHNPILNFNWLGIIPNDDLFCYQWNLREYPGINVREAWRHTKGEGVTIAVIDSGINFNSGDFDRNRFVQGYDIKQDITITLDNTVDRLGHGTHIAGTIAQATNNRIGTAGIAYKAKLMPIRVDLENTGNPKKKSVQQIAKAIKKAVELKADIINLSLDSPKENELWEIQNAAEDAYKQGKLIVAAVGNKDEQGQPKFPIIRRNENLNALIVAAKHGYSNNNGANIYAPGGKLIHTSSCKFVSNDEIRADEKITKEIKEAIAQTDQKDEILGVRLCHGTSQATAHISGVAALVTSVLKTGGITNIQPDLVISIIEYSAHIAEYDRSNDCHCIGKLHTPDEPHYVDAGYAVNLAKLFVRNQTLLLKSNMAISQQISNIVQQHFAEISRREKTLFESLIDISLIVVSLIVLLLCLYILSIVYNIYQPQFFVAIFITCDVSLWLISQTKNDPVTHTFVLFLLPFLAIICLIDPLLDNIFWRWMCLGAAIGSGISLAYATSILNTQIIPFPVSPLVLIPGSILISLPAWIVIKAEDQRLAWGISIGAVITLVTHAFLFSRNLAIVLVVCAGIIFLLSHFLIDTHYRGLNFHSATGIAVILANTTFISQKYLSHLPQWFPAIFLSLTVISYFVAWLKPNVVT